jgi:hypothetical protein
VRARDAELKQMKMAVDERSEREAAGFSGAVDGDLIDTMAKPKDVLAVGPRRLVGHVPAARRAVECRVTLDRRKEGNIGRRGRPDAIEG